MPNETELRVFTHLEREGSRARSQVPGSVRKGDAYTVLLSAGILREAGKGGGYVVEVVDGAAFTAYLDTRYPGRHDAHVATAAGNVRRYRNSKAGKTDSAGVVLLRGARPVELNGHAFNLPAATKKYGCAAAVKPSLNAGAVCVVENLSSFFRAEELLGPHYTYVHTYGRLGKDTFTDLECSDLVHFGDLDYTGLDEYLRLKERFPHAELYCPLEWVERIWPVYSLPLKEGAVITKRVKGDRCDVGVQRVRTLLERTNCFLEQQAFFDAASKQP